MADSRDYHLKPAFVKPLPALLVARVTDLLITHAALVKSFYCIKLTKITANIDIT